jgi:F0F1-type ATP synthase assembly protein I
MTDAVRAILTLTVFLIAFPALYIVFKEADPQLKAIVGAAVFLLPCFMLLWEDLVRFEKSTSSHRLERDRAT